MTPAHGPAPEELENTDLPTLALGLDGRVLVGNEAFCALVGRRHSEVAHRSLADLGVVLEEGALDAEAEVGDARVQVRRADGSSAPAVLSWRLLPGARGRPPYLHVVLFDEAPRVEAERARQAVEARWQSLLSHSADIGWTAGPDCVITDATPSLLHHLGWRLEQVRGQVGFDYVHPNDVARFRRAWDQLVAGRTRQTVVECRLRDVEGRWHWVRETLTDLRDDPSVGAISGHVLDISEWREQDRLRLHLTRQYRARFEQSPVPQATVDGRGTLIDVNRAFGDLLRAQPDELLGRPVWALNHEQDGGEADAVLAQLLSGRLDAARAERVVARTDGEAVPVLADLNVLRDDSGRPDGVALFWHDLTRLHDVQRQQREQAEFFEALSRRANDLALVLDRDGRILYASPGVLRALGYDSADLVSLEEWSFVHPEDLPRARQAFAEVLARGGSRTFTMRTRDAQGAWRWVEETVTNLLDTSVRGIVWNGREVTDRVEAEQALRASEARYRAIAETGAEGIWAVDPAGRTLYVNARLAEILGRSQEELYGRSVMEILDPEERERMRERLRQRNDVGVEHYEVAYSHPDGTTRVLAVAATPLRREDGTVEGSLGMVSDVTEARRVEEELRHAALHDSLTGLPNRTLLMDRLERSLGRSPRSTAVAVVDLDHFKLVNDLHGHAAADDLLVTLAQRLREAARANDTVARFGEDQFVVVLEDVDEAEADALTEQLLAALAQPVALPGGEVRVSASIGLALSPPGTAADLLRAADTAMYGAKRAGRARVHRYDDTLAEAAEQRYALATDLREALAADRLRLHYQPVVELSTGTVLGMEALARWHDPRRGDVPPAEFVPAAEEFGLSHELDVWVIAHALREAPPLQERGEQGANRYVAVNLSARNLAERRLEERLMAEVETAGITPTRVLLEVTESALMEDPRTAVALLTRLRARGFPVAIDDFGTGYSSLAYLRDLPITVLKVDRSFVARITEDRDSLAIVASIVDLAKVVGVTVVAEGVETREQAALLRRLGCHAGQGWLWSRALTVEEIAAAGGWPDAFPPIEAAPGRPVRRGSSHAPFTAAHGLDRLLELHAEGASLQTIASALNREGYRTPNDRRWHSTSVAEAIAERVYPSLRPEEPRD